MDGESSCRISFDEWLLDRHHGQGSGSAAEAHRSSSAAVAHRPSSAMLRCGPRLGFRDYRLHSRIGSSTVSSIFCCSRRDERDPVYAMKMVDKRVVEKKNKSRRVEMERRILKMVHHPFLPTLYAEFEVSYWSCIVMEFYSGGDLHTLLHKQPNERFSLAAARFYAAEVLVALEYLHMLGVIHKDLKLENVLVRSDGHIMLSDFDLSLCSDAIPAVISPSTTLDFSSALPPPFRYDPHPQPQQTIPPSPLPFSCLPCLNQPFLSCKNQNLDPSNRVFVAEPVGARSQSFVGTHEYMAPEMASGGSHGNAVDWWALGIFIYEMVYGRTPFVGASSEATLRNIVQKPLAFPSPDAPSTAHELHTRDLISGLLCKDPARRLGSRHRSADVKRHPFFEGLNFALVRSLTPPQLEA